MLTRGTKRVQDFIENGRNHTTVEANTGKLKELIFDHQYLTMFSHEIDTNDDRNLLEARRPDSVEANTANTTIDVNSGKLNDFIFDYQYLTMFSHEKCME